jgi:hypothetical protein
VNIAAQPRIERRQGGLLDVVTEEAEAQQADAQRRGRVPGLVPQHRTLAL